MYEKTPEFEVVACQYVGMLFEVALKLTRDSEYAERLTRRTLLDAYKLYDGGLFDAVKIKGKLLRLMRSLYVEDVRWIQSVQTTTPFIVGRREELVAGGC